MGGGTFSIPALKTVYMGVGTFSISALKTVYMGGGTGRFLSPKEQKKPTQLLNERYIHAWRDPV